MLEADELKDLLSVAAETGRTTRRLGCQPALYDDLAMGPARASDTVAGRVTCPGPEGVVSRPGPKPGFFTYSRTPLAGTDVAQAGQMIELDLTVPWAIF